jgi:hypothetical protein
MPFDPKKWKPRKWNPRPGLLLCPQVPMPMSGVAPRVVLGEKWWDATRKEVYKVTAYHCAACGVWKHEAKGPKHLEAHEVYNIDYLLGRMTLREIVGLCHYCHSYIHFGRLKALLEKKAIGQATYVAIIQHGDKVLASAGLKRLPVYYGPVAAWEDWRLVIGRKKYPPLYKTYQDWEKAFGPGEVELEFFDEGNT